MQKFAEIIFNIEKIDCVVSITVIITSVMKHQGSKLMQKHRIQTHKDIPHKKTEKEKDARNKSVTTLQNMQRQQPKTHGINTQVIQGLMRNRCRQRVAIVKNEGSYGHR